MKTYKITFNNITPICMTTLPTFDGILAYAYAKEQQGQQVQKLHYDKSELIDFSSMPIQMHPDGYFMASWMFYAGNGVEFLDSWKKRWDNQNDDLASFGKQKRKVRINAGQFKSYDMKMRVVDTGGCCWFYFRSSAPQEVARLITSHVPGIGKKTAYGKGLFESFDITAADSNVFDKIIRPIPAKAADLQDGSYRLMAWKPPYWMPENMAFCKI